MSITEMGTLGVSVLLIAGHILNVIKLNSTVLNQIWGFSVLCYNDEIQKWKVNVVSL